MPFLFASPRLTKTLPPARRYQRRLVTAALVMSLSMMTLSTAAASADTSNTLNPTAPVCGSFPALLSGSSATPIPAIWSVDWQSQTDPKYAPGATGPVTAAVLAEPHPNWYVAPSGATWLAHPAFAPNGYHADADGDAILNEAATWSGVPVTGPTGDWVWTEYSTQFDLSPDYGSTSILTLEYRVDDRVDQLLVNGVPQTLPTDPPSPTESISVTGLRSGVNRITFAVDSGPDYGSFLLAEASVAQSGDADGDNVLDCDDPDFDATPYEDLDSSEDELVRLYRAAFQRLPDAAGFAYWNGLVNQGLPLSEITRLFAESAEFASETAEMSDEAFVDFLYSHTLYRSADAAGRQYWLERLEAGVARGDVLLFFSQAAEFKDLHGLT